MAVDNIDEYEMKLEGIKEGKMSEANQMKISMLRTSKGKRPKRPVKRKTKAITEEESKIKRTRLQIATEDKFSDLQLGFCESRAKGYTYAQSYIMAGGKSKNPAQEGYSLERLEKISCRIAMHKAENRAAANITISDQIGRWNSVYLQMMLEGQTKYAMDALKNMDELCGFRDLEFKDKPASSININVNGGGVSNGLSQVPEAMKGLLIDASSAVLEIDEETGEEVEPEEGSSLARDNEFRAAQNLLSKLKIE